MVQHTGSMEQFHTYSTYTYRNFSERMISDLEQMICNFSKLPRYQALTKFYDELQAHLNNPKAHNFDIGPYTQTLLQQMYQAYLNAGYTGNINDMLNSLIKNVSVATAKDSQASYSTTKAETVQGFHTRLGNHNRLRKAHNSLYQQFVRQGIPGLEPYWYYNYELNNFPGEVGEEYPLKGWDQKAGTIFMQLNYRDQEEPVQLFELNDSGIALRFSLEFINGVVKIVVRYGNVTKVITPPFPGGGTDKLVLSYTPELIVIRDLLTTIQAMNPVAHFNPTTITLQTAFGNSGTCLSELAYYPVSTNKSEMLFFLNS